MGTRSVERNIRRDIRLDIPERGMSDGFVTKGDGLRSITHKEEYHTLFCGAVFLWVNTLCCLVRLLQFALPCFPAVHVGHIGIE